MLVGDAAPEPLVDRSPLIRGLAGMSLQAVVQIDRARLSSLVDGRRRSAQVLRQQPRARQIVERGNDQSLGQIAIGAENHDRTMAGRDGSVRGTSINSRLSIGHSDLLRAAEDAACGLSTWPPNSKRIADSSFSPKVCSMRGAEAGKERRGEHLGGHGFVDRGLDGPAAFAGILQRCRRNPRGPDPWPAPWR